MKYIKFNKKNYDIPHKILLNTEYHPKLTVALPAYNANKIIWLALESLITQDIDVYWELMICEEHSESLNIVKNYIKKLKANKCCKITYISIDPIKMGQYPIKFLLLEKWIYMSHLASSNIFILMACDTYGHSARLKYHHKHFQNKDCIVSTQPMGVFYNISNNKIFIFDGIEKDKIKKEKRLHLNIAFRTKDMRRVRITKIMKGIDSYIFNEIKRMYNFNSNKNIYYYRGKKWKYGIDTDGMNNISLERSRFYDIDEKTVNCILNALEKDDITKLNKYPAFFCLPLHDQVVDKYKYYKISDFISNNILLRLSQI